MIGVLREKFQLYLIVKEEHGLRFFCEWGAEGEISILSHNKGRTWPEFFCDWGAEGEISIVSHSKGRTWPEVFL